MDTREKLIELVTAALCNQSAEEVADHLIANGVTIQRWIPVTERLPEEHDSIWAKLYGTKSWQPGLFRKCSYDVNACVENKDGSRRVISIRTFDGKWDWHKLRDNEQVTRWMPLPEPPVNKFENNIGGNENGVHK